MEENNKDSEVKSPVQMVVANTYSDLEKFLKLLENYRGSKAQLQRVWGYVAKNSFTDGFQFSYPEEKELFEVYESLTNNKLLLMLHKLEMDGVIQAVDKTEVVETTKDGEEKNGEQNS